LGKAQSRCCTEANVFRITWGAQVQAFIRDSNALELLYSKKLASGDFESLSSYRQLTHIDQRWQYQTSLAQLMAKVSDILV
jgi:hypothetical protein